MQNFKQSFLSWIIFSWTVIFSLVWFTVYAGSFDWVTSMSQTWFNLVNSKLNWTYTSWKMCTSDATWQIQCITNVPAWTTWLWEWQTRQDMISQRVAWTTYTNNSWKSIQIFVTWLAAVSNFQALTYYVNWLSIWIVASDSRWRRPWASIIIPNWSTYMVSVWVSWWIYSWFELR